jgi:hypothetical protein
MRASRTSSKLIGTVSSGCGGGCQSQRFRLKIPNREYYRSGTKQEHHLHRAGEQEISDGLVQHEAASQRYYMSLDRLGIYTVRRISRQRLRAFHVQSPSLTLCVMLRPDIKHG